MTLKNIEINPVRDLSLNGVKNLTLVETILPRVENKVLILIRDFVLVLGFTVLTAISAKLKIEIGPVPITMQTLAVLLSGALLGSKKGVASQITYLLGGLAGIPWFSRGGGIQYLLSPTFGYIIGFVFASYLVGFLSERGLDKKIETSFLAMLAGNIVLYIPGLLWLVKFVGTSKILSIGFYPFLLGDLFKIILAGLFLPLGWQLIKRLYQMKI